MTALETCPFLHESLMQYCAAASVTRLVPYSESLLSRCGNPSYRYCELYLQMAHPLPPAETVDGLPMPADLGYSANHMWLDTAAQAGGDGVCYAGIDAFLSRMLGPGGTGQLRVATGPALSHGGSHRGRGRPGNHAAISHATYQLQSLPACQSGAG